MKNEMAPPNKDGTGEGPKADAPPQKKQKIVVEKMPDDWKMKCYSESPKADSKSSE